MGVGTRCDECLVIQVGIRGKRDEAAILFDYSMLRSHFFGIRNTNLKNSMLFLENTLHL